MNTCTLLYFTSFASSFFHEPKAETAYNFFNYHEGNFYLATLAMT